MGYITEQRWLERYNDQLDYLKSWDLECLHDLSELSIDDPVPDEIITVGGWNGCPQGGQFWSNYYQQNPVDEDFLREIKRNIQIITTGNDPAFVEDTGTELPDYLYQREDDV